MLTRLFNRKESKKAPQVGINQELAKLGASFEVNGRRIAVKNRSCQVFGRYIDFWENGMKWLGVDCVEDHSQMAKLLYFWLDLRLDSTEIEQKVPGIQFPESRKKIEEGEDSFLNWYWDNLRDKKDRRFGNLIDLFSQNERTRKLMSFTRLRDFIFSNRIPPLNHHTPFPLIRITDNADFEVHVNIGIVDDEGETHPRRMIGKGSADEVFAIVLNYLPDPVATARYEWNEEESSPAA